MLLDYYVEASKALSRHIKQSTVLLSSRVHLNEVYPAFIVKVQPESQCEELRLPPEGASQPVLTLGPWLAWALVTLSSIAHKNSYTNDEPQ